MRNKKPKVDPPGRHTSLLDAAPGAALKPSARPTLTSRSWTLFVLLIAVLFAAWSITLIVSVNEQQRVVSHNIELTARLSRLEQAIRELETGVMEPPPPPLSPGGTSSEPASEGDERGAAPSVARWQHLYSNYRAQIEALSPDGSVDPATGAFLAQIEATVARMDDIRARFLRSSPDTPEKENLRAEFQQAAGRALHQARAAIQSVRSELVSQSLTLASKHGSLRMLVAASLVLAAFVGVLLFTLKRTYIMLHQSEARLRLLIGQLPAVLWTTDTKFRVTSFLGSELTRLNVGPDQIIGTTIPEDNETKSEIRNPKFETNSNDQNPKFKTFRISRFGFRISPEGGQPEPSSESTTYEVQWRGQTFLAHVEPLYDTEGRQIGSAGVALDITARKQAEMALCAEKERLAVTLRSIADGVITTDPEGRITLLNPVAETLTGWTQQEAIGKPLSDVFHTFHEKTRQPRENALSRVLRTGSLANLLNNTILIARDGTERLIASSGAPIRNQDGDIIGVVLVFRDTTEQQRLQEELQKASRLESLGILAGGLAHDFNNILTAILANVSLAKLDLSQTSEPFQILTEAEQACLRARDLTRQLLTFSKGGLPIKETASISELITGSVNFVLRGSGIRCEFSIPDDLWSIEIDQGQMNQVIHNLMINAKQAMPGGGIINVSAENTIVEARDGLPLTAGPYIKLSIEDQGVGIPEKHLPKIFDPYFSTKQDGSGLGLATTYSIIKQHDGHIIVDSTPGKGTTFTIYLPASPNATPSQKIQDAITHAHGGKALIMDDEPNIRSSAAKMLERLGYEVGCARDGAEAIEVYIQAKEAGRPFDVVITDLTIPGGMGGKEVIQKLLHIDPQVRAIVCSGYSNDPVMANYKQYGFRGLIVKPYTIQELSQTLQQVMNGNKE